MKMIEHYGVEDGDTGDDGRLGRCGGEVVDLDAVTEVICVLEEDEDATGEELVNSTADSEAEA